MFFNVGKMKFLAAAVKKECFFNTASKIHRRLEGLQSLGSSPGVVQRWVGGRGRSAYNLRLPPKASGKDTGPWPAPGFKGLRLTAGRRPSNDVWRMVWEDGAEILRANPGRAMSGIMRSACLYGRAHVEPSCPRLGLMLRQVGPMFSHIGPILGLCWAKLGWAHVELCWAYLGPMSGLCWPMLGLCWRMLSPLGSYVGAMFGPSMLNRS